MKELPEGCYNTFEHALVHINSTLEFPNDTDQVLHDLYIVKDILENMKEETLSSLQQERSH